MSSVNNALNQVGLRILIQCVFLACSLIFTQSTLKSDLHCFVISFYFVTVYPMTFDTVRTYINSGHILGINPKLKDFAVIVRYDCCVHTSVCIALVCTENYTRNLANLIRPMDNSRYISVYTGYTLCTQVIYTTYMYNTT